MIVIFAYYSQVQLKVSVCARSPVNRKHSGIPLTDPLVTVHCYIAMLNAKEKQVQ